MSGPWAGRIFTVAGNGSRALATDGALGNETGLSGPIDVFSAVGGDVLIADYNLEQHCRILRVSARDSRVRVLAGSATAESPEWFPSDSPALSTSLIRVTSVCQAAHTADVYFSDTQRVIRITDDARLVVVAGVPPALAGPFYDGGLASQASFSSIALMRPGLTPASILLTNLYDGTAYRVDLAADRVFVEAGNLRTASLTQETAVAALASRTHLEYPYDVNFDPVSGDIFIAVLASDVVLRVFARDGTAKVVAGTGFRGNIDGYSAPDATKVALWHPDCVLPDASGGLVICDYRNCLLERVDLNVRDSA